MLTDDVRVTIKDMCITKYASICFESTIESVLGSIGKGKVMLVNCGYPKCLLVLMFLLDSLNLVVLMLNRIIRSEYWTSERLQQEDFEETSLVTMRELDIEVVWCLGMNSID